MRVTMVNKFYPPHIGGIEFHARDLAEALASAGHQVRVIVANSSNRYDEELINGVEVVRLPLLTEKASTPIVRHFGKVLAHESRSSDVIHFHFPYPWGEFQWIRQTESKTKPYVVTYHADIVRQKAALAAYKPFLNTFLDRAKLIMASSPQLIENSAFLNVRQDKCRQVNFGLDLDYIAHNPAAIADGVALRQQYGVDRPLVLFVGRLIYYKGVDVLVDAMQFVDADFVVIGKGPLRESMIAQATALGTVDRLHLIDFASNEELAAWYHAADVLALPSVSNSEAFGLVQIEAHAAATPTVSTLLPTGVPYANLDGVTGYSVPVGDSRAFAHALNVITSNPQLQAQFGATAKKRALTEFSVENMVRNVTNVYAEAIAG